MLVIREFYVSIVITEVIELDMLIVVLCFQMSEQKFPVMRLLSTKEASVDVELALSALVSDCKIIFILHCFVQFLKTFVVH